MPAVPLSFLPTVVRVVAATILLFSSDGFSRPLEATLLVHMPDVPENSHPEAALAWD